MKLKFEFETELLTNNTLTKYEINEIEKSLIEIPDNYKITLYLNDFKFSDPHKNENEIHVGINEKNKTACIIIDYHISNRHETFVKGSTEYKEQYLKILSDFLN